MYVRVHKLDQCGMNSLALRWLPAVKTHRRGLAGDISCRYDCRTLPSTASSPRGVGVLGGDDTRLHRASRPTEDELGHVTAVLVGAEVGGGVGHACIGVGPIHAAKEKGGGGGGFRIKA